MIVSDKSELYVRLAIITITITTIIFIIKPSGAILGSLNTRVLIFTSPGAAYSKSFLCWEESGSGDPGVIWPHVPSIFPPCETMLQTSQEQDSPSPECHTPLSLAPNTGNT